MIYIKHWKSYQNIQEDIPVNMHLQKNFIAI